MKRSTTTITSFLVRIYTIVVLATLVFTGLLVVSNLAYQISMSSAMMSQKLSKVLESHQRELLREIVLSDDQSLQEHIELLTKQLDVDRIVIDLHGEAEGKHLVAAASPVYSLSSVDRAALEFMKIPRFQYEIRNYFGQHFGTIEVEYADSLYQHTLSPMLKQVRLISCIILLFFSILFIYVYAKFISNLAKPLNAISGYLRGVKGSALEPKTRGIEEIVEVHNTLLEYDRLKREMARLEIEAERDQIARQVVHDIRGPLAALEMVSADLPEMAEEKRMILRSALFRIRDIANHLLEKYRGSTRDDTTQIQIRPVQLLSSLVEEIISEKRVQYSGCTGIEIADRLSAKTYGLFSSVDPSDFKRVISNLIDNSVEAIPSQGGVTVGLAPEADWITVSVEDTGVGIPEEMISQVTEKGFTHGKQKGVGLGLYFVKTTVAQWGGELRIASELNKGTTVQLRLKSGEPPAWFVDRLSVAPEDGVVIFDDESTIYYAWKARFEAAGKTRGLLHFRTASELRNWWHKKKDARWNGIYLMDYEILRESITGLDLISELGIERDAILVTNRSDEKKVQEACLQKGVRLVSKRDVRFVPIQLISREHSDTAIDAIIIDDDELVHAMWAAKAKECGKRIRAFKNANDFVKNKDRFDRGTPVYVDSNLGDGIRGEEISRRLSHDGFENIYLATGFSPDQFPAMPWLKGIVGKAPPWV